MVRVCDAIMGSGKSSSTITYINEHTDRKFIYITPYLKEAERIKRGCPGAHFVEPSNKIKEFGFSKSRHTMTLIREGRNIATTHQAFKRYTKETLDDIRRIGYTLIIDENVDVLEEFEFSTGDLQMAVDAGYIKEENNVLSLTGKEYQGTALSEMFSILKSRELIRTPATNARETLFHWVLPPDLITAFQDVFILTYLFRSQSIHHFLEIYHIPYSYVGIERDGDTYRFGDPPGYVPEYVHKLKDMLHIVDSEKMNRLGDPYYALSVSWFERGGEDVEQLKKNIGNCYNNIWRNIPADRRLWGAFNGAYNVMKGKGYTKSFLTFNAKATNEYRNRDCLVYIANVFMNVSEKNFYKAHGIEVNEDEYALSIMIQWLWRSAIRDGAEIYIYIPSRRMRDLLLDWVNTIDKE